MAVEEERQAYITNPNGEQNKGGEVGEPTEPPEASPLENDAPHGVRAVAPAEAYITNPEPRKTKAAKP
jgi:hypothetical protein